MFESIKNKVKFVTKNIRNVAGAPMVWGTVAVFSPTFVACYGMPMDEVPSEGELVKSEYNFDCIGGYVKLMETLEYESGWQVNGSYFSTDKPVHCLAQTCPEETYDECTKTKRDAYNEKFMKCVTFDENENGIKTVYEVDYDCIQKEISD